MKKEEVNVILNEKIERTYWAYNYVINRLLEIPLSAFNETDSYYYEWFLAERDYLLKIMSKLEE